RLEWRERTAVILCGSQKTLPNGIYVWNNFFQANPYGAVPLVLYHLFQLVVDTLLVPKFEERNPGQNDSANGADMAPAGCHGSVKQK
ncbi:MAG: bile acid:sodium symporter, partial [Verrucomicrobiota bacterium]|nr:bile acid:sodium symporter [Verrucomicrobiota bacterium]